MNTKALIKAGERVWHEIYAKAQAAKADSDPERRFTEAEIAQILQEARDRLRDAVADDPVLVDLLLDFGCDEIIRTVHRSLRHTCWRVSKKTPAFQPKVYSEETKARVEELNYTLYNMPMMDRVTRLADATREQLMADAEKYLSFAADDLAKGRFLKALAAKMKDGQTVKDAWPERKAIALRDKIQQATLKVGLG